MRLVLLLVLTALAAPALCAAGSLPIAGEAVVLVVPDHAVVVFGIETREPDVVTAKNANDGIAQRFAAAATKLGIAAADLHTDCLTIAPYYHEQDRAERLKPEYFAVSREIVVTIHDLTIVDALLTDAVSAGVNHVGDVEFRTSELRTFRDEARHQAIRAAREKAELLAQELGQKIGRATQISEGVIGWYGYARSARDYRGGQYQNSMTTARGGDDAADTIVPPGRIAVHASVQVTFDLD